MREPTFLDLDEVLEIHRDAIERYGGSHGVRDLGLLQAALAMPGAGVGGQYFHSDLQEMAAAYLFHIAKNHPFVDGNKRTAAVTAFVFLRMNGLTLEAPGRSYEDFVCSVAQGTETKATAAEFIRKHCRP